MDQELKQRIVGAAIITALAAIFVPMLFDDPVDETGKKINQLSIPDIPARLQQATSVKLPKSTEDVMSVSPRKPLTSVGSFSDGEGTLTRWFLQVGIFNQQANALALQNQLRNKGFAASVTQDDSGQAIKYRVRIGPEMTRGKAEQIKQELDRVDHIKSFIFKE